ncbi:MAG: CBS domain-containing protein [Bacteroidales bacterium]|jgi:CBS domain-containing protein|nr:CBS domain-containing protein [Bacteroidales bacterium]
MIAKEIVSYDIPPLKVSDTCPFALNVMDENRVNHLPVVNERELLGVVSEFDLVNHSIPEDIVGNVRLSLPNAFVSEYQHVFDVMKMMTEMKLSLLPVVDQRNGYNGVITLPNLVRFLTLNMSVLNPGGLIILEVAENDYSMAEISNIVESNDARIIGAFFTTRPDSTLIDLTLKINNIDLNPVIQTFERYNYTIKATFAEKDDLDELKERYDALMNFLNI